MALTHGASNGSEAVGWLRPQSVVFTLLAEHLLGSSKALFSGSFIEVLAEVGIGEHATRSTLARMVRRGFLVRERRGRKIYLGLTDRCTRLLEGGRDRIWHMGAVNERRADAWTLLTFSLPSSSQQKRYGLRSRLAWAGFGPLRSGVWIAPADVDVAPIVADLGLEKYVRVFRSELASPTDPQAVIREAFDLDAIAEQYHAFLHRWRAPPAEMDALSLTLRLGTDWIRTLREDPRVPVHLLPNDWPAMDAEQCFRELHAEHYPAALRRAESVFETVELGRTVGGARSAASARSAARL